VLGLALGWWLYVPIHELLHAYGCLWTGGEVTRLEIDALYGGAWLAEALPFVEVGSEYAGQLTGFDTRGSDAIYLATDLAPFLLTVFPGVWALRRFGGRGQAVRFGLVLPLALAPFLSVTGDAYEIGSILVTQLPPWTEAAMSELLRGDDLFLAFERVRAAEPSPWGGWFLAGVVGVLWAFATYGAGAVVARWLSSGRVEEAP